MAIRTIRIVGDKVLTKVCRPVEEMTPRIQQLIDDMVDTAGTITKAANLMLENGAKSVRAIASHAVMSDPASTRVDQSALTEMIFTDSIPYAKKCEKVKVLSVADMFAEAIRRVCSGESISSLYAI